MNDKARKEGREEAKKEASKQRRRQVSKEGREEGSKEAKKKGGKGGREEVLDLHFEASKPIFQTYLPSDPPSILPVSSFPNSDLQVVLTKICWQTSPWPLVQLPPFPQHQSG